MSSVELWHPKGLLIALVLAGITQGIAWGLFIAWRLVIGSCWDNRGGILYGNNQNTVGSTQGQLGQTSVGTGVTTVQDSQRICLSKSILLWMCCSKLSFKVMLHTTQKLSFKQKMGSVELHHQKSLLIALASPRWNHSRNRSETRHR